MGLDDSVSVDEKMANSNDAGSAGGEHGVAETSWHLYLVVLLFAAAVYLACIVSPPSLMDDVDAVQAQIARNMLTSGDWVTARLDGVAYLEKAPLIYWVMAGLLQGFRRARLGGAHCRLRSPPSRSAWLTAAFGVWAFGKTRRILRRVVHGHVHRPVSVHPHSDSRRHADASPSRWRCGHSCARSTKKNRIRGFGPSFWPPASGLGLLLKSLIARCLSRRRRH